MTAPSLPPSPPSAPANPDPALAPQSVYRHAGFVSFLIARVVAVVATQVQAVVVAWQVYDLTREPLALAYVGLAQFLPMLCLLLPAGDLILYPSGAPHRVEPVTRGVRLACVGWIESHVRDASAREVLWDLERVGAAWPDNADPTARLTLDKAIGALLRRWAET